MHKRIMNEKIPSPKEIMSNIFEIISRKYSYLAIKQEEFGQAKTILESKIDET